MQLKFNYVTLPASITDCKLTSSQLSVIVYLYSLVYERAKYKVKVRQEVIADRCHTSVATVRRATAVLEQLGFIVGKYRSKKKNGYLGTYTYYLREVGDRCFRISRRTALTLSHRLLSVYVLCCKCAESKGHCFYHSYNDLASLLGMQRSEVMTRLEELCQANAVKKSRRLAKAGDFSENIYFVVAHEYSVAYVLRIVKSFRQKNLVIAVPKTSESEFIAVICFYFSFRGGGVENERSNFQYPLIYPSEE